MLVLKSQDPFTLLFSNPAYLTALFSGVRIFELFNELLYYNENLLQPLTFKIKYS